MGIKTISKDAKKSVIGLLSKLLQVEYDFIFSYPQVIERLVNVDGVHDEQIVDALEDLVKDSLHHFNGVDELIKRLGGETKWNINALDLSAGVEEILKQQLEKEIWAVTWYQSVNEVAKQGKVGASDFSGKSENFVNVDDIVRLCERNISDEERHQSLVRDSIAKLRMLKTIQSERRKER